MGTASRDSFVSARPGVGAAVASELAVAALGPELGVTVATAVMTVLVLVFCEVLPKAVAARNGDIPHASALLNRKSSPSSHRRVPLINIRGIPAT
jgi:hypothetical protein